MRYILIILLLIASPLLAQNGKRINRHKLYDTTSVDHKVKSRQLTADVDSTGIAMYAWGDECYFKINLLERMLIKANYYRTGDRNGHPYILYGNDNFRFRMYINDGGNFEFDAKIRNKSPNGRHELPFNIQSKGLNFYFQDSIMDADKETHFRPDSVVYSYAVYHSTKRDNRRTINGSDTTFENYGTGKAFHIYRPKAWDAAGDTVWGYLRITEDMMFIGVDSTWMANAEYPVTIDPNFGNEAHGGGLAAFIANEVLFMNTADTTGAGTLTGGRAYMLSWGDSAKVAVYKYNSTYSSSELIATSDAAQQTDYGWMEFTITGTLDAATGYGRAVMGNNNWRIYYDDVTDYNTHKYNNVGSFAFNDPAGTEDDNHNNDYSVYFIYTESGGSSSQVIMIQ